MARKAEDKKILFSKAELKAYIDERGYLISSTDLDNWYDYYLKTEFCYVQGKLRIHLKNWKADVNMKLRNGKFNVKKKTPPKAIEKQPEIIPATPKQKAELRKRLEALTKKMTPKIYKNKGYMLTNVKRQIEKMKSSS